MQGGRASKDFRCGVVAAQGVFTNPMWEEGQRRSERSRKTVSPCGKSLGLAYDATAGKWRIMKNTVSRFVVWFAFAICFLSVRGKAAESVGAKLAPAESPALIEIHDVPRTMARWKETAFYKISEEPEWKAFTSKLDKLLDEVPDPGLVRGIFAEIAKVDPSAAFFALAEVPDFKGARLPKLLGGISYRGETAHVRSLLGSLREKLQQSGAVKIESSTEGGVDFEAASIGDVTVTLAYVDKWIFAATDRQLLMDAIARYMGKAPPGLAGSDTWKTSVKQSVEEPDLTLFISYGWIAKMLAKTGDADAAMFAAMADFMPESWITTVKLEGGGMRERTFMRYKTALPHAQGAHRSLAFTGPDTIAYLEADYSGWVEPYKKLLATIPLPDIPELESSGLKIGDIATTFGPEIALLSDWENGALFLPTAFAAVELLDAAKGRKFAELIAKAMDGGGKVTVKEEDGTKLWTMNLSIPVVKPTLAVNNKHLMFGLNPESVFAPLKRAKEGQQSLLQTPAFSTALKSVAEPNGGMLFVDTKRVFERLYDRGRPFVAMGIVRSPVVAKFLDAVLLPKTETFSKHFTPMMVSFHVDENGYLMESTGPTTYITGTMGVAIGGALLMPAITAARGKARETVAMSNARQIHIAGTQYAANNNGNFPKKLGDLVPKYLDSEKILASPLELGSPDIAYEAVEAKDTDDAGKIWLKSKFLTRAGKRIVVTVGGVVRLDEE